MTFRMRNKAMRPGLMMGLRHHILITLIISGVLLSAPCHADEVVMTTGERFTTSKIWEENGKIRFNMHGLVVSVNKSEVASISGTGGSIQPKTNPKHQPNHGIAPGPQAKASAHDGQPLPAPSSAKQPKPQAKIQGIGFKGISWHMQPTDLPGLKKFGTEEAYGGIDQYWRPDGPMTLGDVLLDGLVFGFWQNRLYSIMIWVDGKPGYDRLEQVVLNRYGKGKKSKNVEHRYVWVDDKTTDRMLEFDAERNIGIFWMRSRDLDTRIKRLYPES